MLTETVLIATCSDDKSKLTRPSVVAPALRDASVLLYKTAPNAGPKHVIKKSSAAQNCVAVTQTHVLAAQADKSVINVFTIENGKLEVAVPFKHRIRSLAVACDGTVACLGFDQGSVGLWELATGRFVQTSSAHLAAVTAMDVSPDQQTLVTGSSDTSVLVWSVASILSFTPVLRPGQKIESTTILSTSRLAEQRMPIHTLAHDATVTCLAVGKIPTHFGAGIVAVGTEDGKLRVWDYGTGNLLRVFLLGQNSIPTSIAMDAADRGAFLGFSDGRIRLVDFYATPKKPSNQQSVDDSNLTDNLNLLNASLAETPVQVSSDSDRGTWVSPKSTEAGRILSIALSFDGGTLLSGHESGDVLAWDTGSRACRADLLLLPAAVTNVIFLPVAGLRSLGHGPNGALIKLDKVTRPNFASMGDESGINGSQQIPIDYSINARLVGDIDMDSGNQHQSAQQRFDEVLYSKEGWPAGYVEDNLAEFLSWRARDTGSTWAAEEAASNQVKGDAGTASEDFMVLDDDTQHVLTADGFPRQQDGQISLQEQNELLKQQVETLQQLQKESFRHIRDLKAERVRYLGRNTSNPG